MTLSVAAGSSATSAFVNSIAPLGVIKPTDETVTSSTTLQNDNDLLAPLVASATYTFLCEVNYEGFTQGASDIKWQWSVPSGAVMRYGLVYVGTGGGLTETAQAGSDTVAAGTAGVGTRRTLKMSGSVVMSTTPGNIQFTWAQNSSSTTATTVHAGSMLTLFRLT